MTRVRLEISVPTSDNTCLNDVIRMIAPFVYLLRRIPSITANYFVENEENS